VFRFEELNGSENYMNYQFCCLIVGALGLTASAETFVVDVGGSTDYQTIQSAIDVASDGDEVQVMQGEYFTINPIDTLGLAIWVHSIDGPELTLVQGIGGGGWHCIDSEGNDTIIEGFTVTKSFSSDGGGGIYCEGTSPTIVDCVFKNNGSGGWGGGAYCKNGEVQFSTHVHLRITPQTMVLVLLSKMRVLLCGIVCLFKTKQPLQVVVLGSVLLLESL
jgi:hypothetical protein